MLLGKDEKGFMTVVRDEKIEERYLVRKVRSNFSVCIHCFFIFPRRLW